MIRKTITTYVRAHPYAIVAIGLIDHGHEERIFVRGTQAPTRLDERTQFQIGSITKLFTASVLAQMVIAGDMKLDDPIQRYLPPEVHAPVYHGHAITLLDLSDHTSGLPTDPPDLSPANASTYSTAMLDRALSATRLTRRPGSKWDYSNFGYAVLGQMLARTANVSYDELIERRILEPLAMNDTVVAGSDAALRRLVPAYEYGGAPAHPYAIGAIRPAGSIESDLKDMLVFLKANVDAPSGTLGPAFAFAQRARTPVPEWNMTMGLAWQTVLPSTHRVPDDLGDLAPGSLEKGGGTDGFSSLIALNHASHWGIVAMTNVTDDDFQAVIAHAVSPSTAKMPILWALVKREPSPLAGAYVTRKGKPSIDIFKYGGALYIWVSAATPGKLMSLSGNRYSWPPEALTLTFNIDKTGRVTGFTAFQGGRTIHATKIH
jgi:serine-type D-Ala-D-Ala carboxypeptidase/endopeptidase